MYQSSLIRFARTADLVVPLRIIKAWVEAPANHARRGNGSPVRRFIPIRSTIVPWPRRAPVEGAPGAVKVAPPDRARLIAMGYIKPAGAGACLELDERGRAEAARELSR